MNNQLDDDYRRPRFTEIFVQEYLRGKRSELIIETMSELSKKIDEIALGIATSPLSAQRIREIIKPLALKAKIKAGHYKIDPDYQSIFKI